MTLKKNLFVYGTLLFPPIWRAVTGQVNPAVPATLPGYARYRIKDQVFPGIISDPAAKVDGRLYGRVSPWQLERLDDYENAFYQRVEVSVTTKDGQLHTAYTYVVPVLRRGILSPDAWQPNWFAKHVLRVYLRHLKLPATHAS